MKEKEVKITYSYKGISEGIIFEMKLQFINEQWLLAGEVGGGCTCSDAIPFKSIIPNAQVHSLLDELTAITISPLQEAAKGLDGGFEEITIVNGWSMSSFSWWDGSHSDFTPLRTITRELQLWANDKSLRLS